MHNKLMIGERLLLTLWVGSLWAIGYIAVPIVFFTLEDRHTAGTVALHMFNAVRLIGLACGTVLLIDLLFTTHDIPWRRNWRLWAILMMLFLIAVSQFMLSPVMDSLRAEGLAEGSVSAKQFGQLHGVASSLYLVTSLLGLSLVVFGLRRGSPDG
jgi:hypothetical protein